MIALFTFSAHADEVCPLVNHVHTFDSLGLTGAVINRVEPGLNADGQLYPEELVLFRRGHFYRSIHPQFFTWDWMFWNGGRQVVANVSPLHFLEVFDLISLQSGKVYASFVIPQSPEDPPTWVVAFQKTQAAEVGELPAPQRDCRFRVPVVSKPAQFKTHTSAASSHERIEP